MSLVTVFVPSYNHERYVLETLESVRLQTYSEVQLIVIDDCSGDGSARVIGEWVETHRSRFVEVDFRSNERNAGICRNMNRALAAAKGTYFAVLGSDDLWLPEKLERQVARFERETGRVGVVYGDTDLMDTAGQPLPGTFMAGFDGQGFLDAREGNLLKPLLVNNFIVPSSTLVRMACFRDVGNYDEGLWFEDWDMWIRIARRYEFAFLPEILTRYRMNSTSMSARGKRYFDEFHRTMAIRYPDLEEPYASELNERLIVHADWLYEIGSAHAPEAVRRARAAFPGRYWNWLSLALRLRVPHRVFHRVVDGYLRRKPGAAVSGRDSAGNG